MSLRIEDKWIWDFWLARYEGSCGSLTIYCTAKTNSAGCTPAIGSLGTPSKSGGPGTFDVTLSDTRPNKAHIYFYSINTARSSAPFQGGFLCMQPPVRRTGVEITSSAGECTSGASVDFGAIMATAGFISAGDVIRGEWWGRDTPGNSSLSDAIEFTVCP